MCGNPPGNPPHPGGKEKKKGKIEKNERLTKPAGFLRGKKKTQKTFPGKRRGHREERLEAAVDGRRRSDPRLEYGPRRAPAAAGFHLRGSFFLRKMYF